MKWVCHWRGLGNHMDPGEELPETKGKLDLLNYEFLHKRNMLFGTPEYVIDKIHELKSELNLQNLTCLVKLSRYKTPRLYEKYKTIY